MRGIILTFFSRMWPNFPFGLIFRLDASGSGPDGAGRSGIPFRFSYSGAAIELQSTGEAFFILTHVQINGRNKKKKGIKCAGSKMRPLFLWGVLRSLRTAGHGNRLALAAPWASPNGPDISGPRTRRLRFLSLRIDTIFFSWFAEKKNEDKILVFALWYAGTHILSVNSLNNAVVLKSPLVGRAPEAFSVCSCDLFPRHRKHKEVCNPPCNVYFLWKIWRKKEEQRILPDEVRFSS